MSESEVSALPGVDIGLQPALTAAREAAAATSLTFAVGTTSVSRSPPNRRRSANILD
jgi:hypothetical protein